MPMNQPREPEIDLIESLLFQKNLLMLVQQGIGGAPDEPPQRPQQQLDSLVRQIPPSPAGGTSPRA
jgi:hypothetical protein